MEKITCHCCWVRYNSTRAEHLNLLPIFLIKYFIDRTTVLCTPNSNQCTVVRSSVFKDRRSRCWCLGNTLTRKALSHTIQEILGTSTSCTPAATMGARVMLGMGLASEQVVHTLGSPITVGVSPKTDIVVVIDLRCPLCFGSSYIILLVDI